MKTTKALRTLKTLYGRISSGGKNITAENTVKIKYFHFMIWRFFDFMIEKLINGFKGQKVLLKIL